MDFDESNSESFYEAVKRFIQLKVGVIVTMLIFNKEKVIADIEKAKSIGENFFRVGHLEAKNMEAISSMELNLRPTWL